MRVTFGRGAKANGRFMPLPSDRVDHDIDHGPEVWSALSQRLLASWDTSLTTGCSMPQYGCFLIFLRNGTSLCRLIVQSRGFNPDSVIFQ